MPEIDNNNLTNIKLSEDDRNYAEMISGPPVKTRRLFITDDNYESTPIIRASKKSAEIKVIKEIPKRSISASGIRLELYFDFLCIPAENRFLDCDGGRCLKQKKG